MAAKKPLSPKKFSKSPKKASAKPKKKTVKGMSMKGSMPMKSKKRPC